MPPAGAASHVRAVFVSSATFGAAVPSPAALAAAAGAAAPAAACCTNATIVTSRLPSLCMNWRSTAPLLKFQSLTSPQSLAVSRRRWCASKARAVSFECALVAALATALPRAPAAAATEEAADVREWTEKPPSRRPFCRFHRQMVPPSSPLTTCGK